MEVKIECDRIYTLCEGCLSSDRRVTGLTEEKKALFYFLRDGTISLKDETKHIQLCWECNGILNKVKDFQSRIKTAQYSLLHYIQSLYSKVNTPPTLSKLKAKETSHYNREYVYNETQPEYSLNNLNNNPNKLLSDQKCIPEELLTEIKIEDNGIKEEYSENSDHDYTYDNDFKIDDFVPEIGTKKRKEKKNKPPLKDYTQFAIVTDNKSVDLNKSYSETIYLSESEIETFLDKDRKKMSFNKFPFNCKECVLGYKRPLDLLRHKMFRHMDEYPTRCLACNTHVHSPPALAEHWRQHTKMWRCALCAEICRSKGEMKKHVNRAHTKIYTCSRCQDQFGTLKEFGIHYNRYHEQVICDYCNAFFTTKRRLERHIVRNHIPPFCNLCNRSFSQYRFLERHTRVLHPEVYSLDANKELCYCVECDIQYPSVQKYKCHLRDSVKHRPRVREKVPCPDCGKIFSKNTYMKNHFRLVHVKESKHYCELCNKYFANGYGVRTHKLYVHQKVPHEKNKICDLCGRGFSTNRILTNHRRTHTGERPFKCNFCSATFAQETACKTHKKSQHKNAMLLNNIPNT
ncbi:zinc finger protein 2 homolog [Trichoplusia ni]|uniref:Zinc finger protein 2 homolog n=1 Tax=Trichoplusia ni TaxID=7111 RepID=A0A7E5X5H6_TRINI|nr:zinc finger protein 2 homolog [Trichoplusia ni]